MSIAFALRQNVQVVRLPGPLSADEEAGVRLKLDQKISAGRSRVLFDLTDFPLSDNSSRGRLLGLISYCQERGVNVAACGADRDRWPLLRVDRQKQVSIYQTEAEALAVFQCEDENGVPSAHSPSTANESGETEFRRKALEAVLKGYEAFQALDATDPFALERLEANFRKEPHRGALIELEKALQEWNTRRVRVHQMSIEAERLADETFEMTLHRKLPLNPDEVAKRRKETQNERDALSRERDQLLEEIVELEHRIQRVDDAAHQARKTLSTKLSKAEADLKMEIDEYNRLSNKQDP